MNQKQAFLAGNFIGLTGLLVAFLVVSPLKEKERKEYEAKQKPPAQAESAPKPETSTMKVVVTKRIIKKGAKVLPDDVEVKEVDAVNARPGALSVQDDAVAHKVKAEVAAGAMLCADDLMP